ncbi:uncharacterized protein [Solanum tuberosum]|uniref:uncharacterized protein n=1 Tax=Solanum tuberosum TaxID=4113 RepID=UPI0003D2463B|nr:PREDICTED: uncharacterized protein LOC102603138 [Solanum tuberosum]
MFLNLFFFLPDSSASPPYAFCLHFFAGEAGHHAVRWQPPLAPPLVFLFPFPLFSPLSQQQRSSSKQRATARTAVQRGAAVTSDRRATRPQLPAKQQLQQCMARRTTAATNQPPAAPATTTPSSCQQHQTSTPATSNSENSTSLRLFLFRPRTKVNIEYDKEGSYGSVPGLNTSSRYGESP